MAAIQPGIFALLGTGALLAATTQGPISTVVLLMEMRGRDRSFIAPLLLAVVTATLVARLTDEEVEARELPGAQRGSVRGKAVRDLHGRTFVACPGKNLDV
jgi:H+/Cl- antiporter ClcA